MVECGETLCDQTQCPGHSWFLPPGTATYKQKLNEVGRGRADGWRHNYVPQLLYVLLCTRIRFEVLYTTRGLAENTKDLRSYIPPYLESNALAISARLKDSTLG